MPSARGRSRVPSWRLRSEANGRWRSSAPAELLHTHNRAIWYCSWHSFDTASGGAKQSSGWTSLTRSTARLERPAARELERRTAMSRGAHCRQPVPETSISRARNVQAPAHDAGPPAALRLSAAVLWAPQRLIVVVSPKFAHWQRLNRNGAVPAAPAHAEPP